MDILNQLSTVLSFIWEYTFSAASDFLIYNGFGMLIIGTLITGIIIDALVEITHIK